MDFHTTLMSVAGVLGNRVLKRDTLAAKEPPHIVDQLIAERTTHLSRHPLWPVARPLLYRYFHYRQALAMADEIAELSGWDAFTFISALLSLNVSAHGTENIPATGGFILAPTHPTGIADGIAVFDLMKERRPDLAIFANRDALRVNPRFRDLIIPVEWRPGEKSHAKSRDTLETTAKAFAENKAVVLFPAGRIAYWNEDKLTERPWQPSVVALARRYEVPVIPVNITARNSGLFYLLSKYSAELRDMTLFHELLNKKGRDFHMTIGRPIAPDLLDGEPADVAAALQAHALARLAEDPAVEFAGDRQPSAA
ncbi:1-acyl-sn-glycerol-3-phosphate acyltransferase [Chelativorans salis]|uniref:1-acyl-sn-glycerol-3-phosphate acyltransferase n=1 Tax=Chelativorans salis TaxID=2978478 RepID=A0ABT2LS96_9HYPH|nr:1-acyl-sn-glycerol-3-phosphate acyltransferase [Chelativorans sp. EGI FJ00035]MCT7376498.1 1-acyl-sn-glycerol-3-phosphate acyltransferase [Chelativorans sp. EGI FJ00035]